MSVRDDTTIRESFNKHDKPGTSRRMGTRSRSSIRYASDEQIQQADPTAVVAKFRSLDAGRSEHYQNVLPDLDLPGTGARRARCGDPIPRGCASCGEVHDVGMTCQNRMCPRCWKAWVMRRATTWTAKLDSLRAKKQSETGSWWKAHHLVLSPPDGYAMNRDDPLDATFDVLKEVLGEIGVDTGVLIYHPYRGPDSDDRGFWKHVLPDGRETSTDELVENHDLTDEPHFHAIVLSPFVCTEWVVEHVEEKTGWVIHRVVKTDESGDETSVSLYDEYDLARSLTYSLSHCGQTDDGAAFRPWGEVHNHTPRNEASRLREANATVRSVAVNTLGVEYDSLACSTERMKASTRTVMAPIEEDIDLDRAVGGAKGKPGPSSSGSSSSSSSSTSSAQEVEEIEVEGKEEIDVCNGRLVEVKAFPRYLEDPEWVERAPHADQMQEAWEEWRERIDDVDGAYADEWDTPGDDVEMEPPGD